MKSKHFHFTESERLRVREAVKAAEKSTTGEIVPWIIAECKGYRWVHGALTLAGIVLATLALAAVYWTRLWDIHLARTLEWQSLGGLLGFALSEIPGVRRALVPASWRSEAVQTRALASFVSARLPDTRDRNGVLIFVSLFERQVKILADRAIHDRAPAGFWDERVKQIVHGIHAARPIDALCESIGETGRLLAQKFPSDGRERTNQLPDGLRED